MPAPGLNTIDVPRTAPEESRMRWVLAALRSGSRGGARIAVSPLAEGSDRIFARAALELGYRLEALLPFESADYV